MGFRNRNWRRFWNMLLLLLFVLTGKHVGWRYLCSHNHPNNNLSTLWHYYCQCYFQLWNLGDVECVSLVCFCVSAVSAKCPPEGWKPKVISFHYIFLLKLLTSFLRNSKNTSHPFIHMTCHNVTKYLSWHTHIYTRRKIHSQLDALKLSLFVEESWEAFWIRVYN